jgi:hypothetical protein
MNILNTFILLLIEIYLLASQTNIYSNAQANVQLTNELPYKYVGNSFSHKFHRPSCQFAIAMNLKKAVLYHFRFQAINDNCVPCRYCLPPITSSVKGSVLGK